MTTTSLIFGEYPGILEETLATSINTCSEETLWFYINAVDNIIAEVEVELKNPPNLGNYKANWERLFRLRHTFDYCAVRTSRFGVKIQPGTNIKRVTLTKSFQDWYLHHAKTINNFRLSSIA